MTAINNINAVSSLSYAKIWENRRIYFNPQLLTAAMGIDCNAHGPVVYPGRNGYLSNALTREYAAAFASVYVDMATGAVVQTVRERDAFGLKMVAELVAEFLNGLFPIEETVIETATETVIETATATEFPETLYEVETADYPASKEELLEEYDFTEEEIEKLQTWDLKRISPNGVALYSMSYMGGGYQRTHCRDYIAFRGDRCTIIHRR